MRRNRARVPGTILAASAAALAGCATIDTLTLPAERIEHRLYETAHSSLPRLYSGTITDARMVGDDASAQMGFFSLLDLPFSIVADTLALPFTLWRQLDGGSYRARCVPELRAEACSAQRRAFEDIAASCRASPSARPDCGSIVTADGPTVDRLQCTVAPCPSEGNPR